MFSLLVGKLKSWWYDRSVLEKALLIFTGILLLALSILIIVIIVAFQRDGDVSHNRNHAFGSHAEQSMAHHHYPMQNVAAENGPNHSSPVTTQIMDMSSGEPADQLRVTVLVLKPGSNGNFTEVAMRRTGEDGKTPGLLSHFPWSKGTYKIVFDTGQYFQDMAISTVTFQRVEIEFAVSDPEQHYHIQAFISPNGYSIYRSIS